MPSFVFPRDQVSGRFWHGVVNVALVTKAGELLCSVRSNNLLSDAGKIQSYFGGGLRPGESHIAAALRELREETGYCVSIDRLLQIDSGMAKDSKRYYHTYVVIVENKIDPVCENDEIVQYVWMDMQDYWFDVNKRYNEWCGRLKQYHLEKIEQIISGLAQKSGARGSNLVYLS